MTAPQESQPASHVTFHDHLDVCRQCREHPFALCTTGAQLLRAAATDDVIEGMRKIYEGPNR